MSQPPQQPEQAAAATPSDPLHLQPDAQGEFRIPLENLSDFRLRELAFQCGLPPAQFFTWTRQQIIENLKPFDIEIIGSTEDQQEEGGEKDSSEAAAGEDEKSSHPTEPLELLSSPELDAFLSAPDEIPPSLDFSSMSEEELRTMAASFSLGDWTADELKAKSVEEIQAKFQQILAFVENLTESYEKRGSAALE